MSADHTDPEPRFQSIDGADRDRVDEFLKDNSFFTAREWALARLCADFRTESGIPMTDLGKALPELVPWMDEQYSPQAVNAARQAFEDKVERAMATALYGAMADFYTSEKLDDLMYDSTERAKLLLEAEGVTVDVETEMEVEEAVRDAMSEIRRRSEELRFDEPECPHCGGDLLEQPDEDDPVDVDVPEDLEEWKEEFLEFGE